MQIGDLLREARKAAGLTQQQVADHFSITKTSVSEWETNKGRPSMERMPQLARLYKTSLQHLMGEPVRPGAHQVAQHMSGTPSSRFGTPAASVEDDPELTIPQYDAGGAMGHGLVLEDRPPGLIKSWRVDHEWLRLNVRHHTGIQNLRIVTGFGPSMRGMFNPGDPLLCDCGVKTVEVDSVYYFRVGEHGFIKMLQRIPTADGMILRAISKNPDYHPFDITAGMDFEVFGKVLTVWKSEVL